jgi:hypothetical protein
LRLTKLNLAELFAYANEEVIIDLAKLTNYMNVFFAPSLRPFNLDSFKILRV